jgi:DNA-binding NtrC family response regulator
MTAKVMIIDDDQDIRESLVDLLENEGYLAVGVASGLAALTQMTWDRFVPDVIVLDLFMPQMNGQQFRTVLQKHPRWSKIPIIICSGDSVTDEVRRSVFGVLLKPFDLDRLFSLVKSACAVRAE